MSNKISAFCYNNVVLAITGILDIEAISLRPFEKRKLTSTEYPAKRKIICHAGRKSWLNLGATAASRDTMAKAARRQWAWHLSKLRLARCTTTLCITVLSIFHRSVESVAVSSLASGTISTPRRYLWSYSWTWST